MENDETKEMTVWCSGVDASGFLVIFFSFLKLLFVTCVLFVFVWVFKGSCNNGGFKGNSNMYNFTCK